MKNNIIPSKIESTRIPPPTIRTVGVSRILYRMVRKWSLSVGTYGMGGPGFFGLQLQKTEAFPEEWLVLTLWAASEWLTFDGRWVFCLSNQYYIQKPLFWYEYAAYKRPVEHDELTSQLVESQIISAEIEDHLSVIRLLKNNQGHTLELPMDSNKLPRVGASLEPLQWNPQESLLDAWVITEENLIV